MIIVYIFKLLLKRNVFKLDLKAFKVGVALTDIGRLFHILGAATLKALLAVAVFTLGCTRRFISDDLNCLGGT